MVIVFRSQALHCHDVRWILVEQIFPTLGANDRHFLRGNKRVQNPGSQDHHADSLP